MRSHEVDYQIFGHEMQLVEVELDPDETVIAEAGAMTYMEEGIEFETKLGDGSDPDQGFFGSIFGAAKRKMTGESLFTTHFTNRGMDKKKVAFAAPYPGKIIAVDLNQMEGNTLLCQFRWQDIVALEVSGCRSFIRRTRLSGDQANSECKDQPHAHDSVGVALTSIHVIG